MLDIPGRPLLDKSALIGACLRLPVAVDAGRLAAEFAALPVDNWTRRVGRHQAAEAVYLRGHAPAEGERPIEDRAPLAQLPYARELIHGFFGAAPMRALAARLPPGGHIVPHVDQAPYFGKTIRVHVPIATNDQVWMYCGGRCYRMQPGEAWALNNSTIHGVLNGHATADRIHLICDFLPDAPLLALLDKGERELGRHDAQVEAALGAALKTAPASA